MSIYFATIEYTEKAVQCARQMDDALLRCSPQELGSLGMELMALSDHTSSLSLSEKEWEDFLRSVRKVRPEFSADYIISPSIINELMPQVSALYAPITDILHKAFQKQQGILELPLEEKK